MPIASLQNLGVTLKKSVILSNINLNIERGETLGIIGLGGAGKTVLLKTLAGLLKPTDGDCHLETTHLTMTFQRSGLFDSMTAEENLYFVLKEGGVPKQERKERVMGALEAVGLGSQGKLFPHELSGGMQKRLGIARALLLKPELVLYDDPTAGLDPVTSRSITDLIQSMKEKYVMTVVLTTSDLPIAFKLSDRIGFLYQGSFVCVESPEKLKQNQSEIVRQFLSGNTKGPLSEVLL